MPELVFHFKQENHVMLKYRWIIITTALLITGFFGWHMLQVEIDPDIKNNIPPNMSSRLNTSKIESLFGKDNMLLIVFESEDILQDHSLERLKTITKKMERMKSFDRIISPANAKNINGADGMMIIEAAIGRIPRTDKQREKLRTKLNIKRFYHDCNNRRCEFRLFGYRDIAAG
jgi:predicted RND superfamily exporter protein